jgi:hypothetical protein
MERVVAMRHCSCSVGPGWDADVNGWLALGPYIACFEDFAGEFMHVLRI